MKLSIQDAVNYATQFDGYCLSKTYKDTKEKMEWKCKYGHTFTSSFGNLKYKLKWCKYCSGRFSSERFCRFAFEKMFNEKFPSMWPSWLIGVNGRRLELDGYCEKLGIAFEHNGEQHSKKIDYYYNKNIIKNDKIKRELCKKNGVNLITIPQLHKIIKLNNLIDFILLKLSEQNIVPKNHSVDFTKVNSSNYAENRLTFAKKLAEHNKGTCLSDKYLNVKEKLLWKCKENHTWYATMDHIKNGTWCPKCYNASTSNRFLLDEEKIIEMYESGSTITDIAKMVKSSKPRLSSILKKNKIKVKNGRHNFDYDELYDLYIVKRLSKREMGRQLQVDHKTISRFLKKYNIER